MKIPDKDATQLQLTSSFAMWDWLHDIRDGELPDCMKWDYRSRNVEVRFLPVSLDESEIGHGGGSGLRPVIAANSGIETGSFAIKSSKMCPARQIREFRATRQPVPFRDRPRGCDW